jgi:hypothetical protein
VQSTSQPSPCYAFSKAANVRRWRRGRRGRAQRGRQECRRTCQKGLWVVESDWRTVVRGREAGRRGQGGGWERKAWAGNQTLYETAARSPLRHTDQAMPRLNLALRLLTNKAAVNHFRTLRLESRHLAITISTYRDDHQTSPKTRTTHSATSNTVFTTWSALRPVCFTKPR